MGNLNRKYVLPLVDAPKPDKEETPLQRAWAGLKWVVGMAVLLFVLYDWATHSNSGNGGGCDEGDYQCESAAHDRIYR